MNKSTARPILIVTALACMACESFAEDKNPSSDRNARAVAVTDADLAWKQIVAQLERSESVGNNYALYNQLLLNYRDEGLRFYYAFPNDPRRWQWLMTTMELRPQYYSKSVDRSVDSQLLPIDEERLQAWDKLYSTELRPAFLSSTDVTDAQRLNMRKFDLYYIINTRGIIRAQRGGAVAFGEIAHAVLAFSEDYSADDSVALMAAKMVLGSANRWKVSGADLEMFVTALCSSPNERLRELGLGRHNFLAALGSKLDLELPLKDGTKWRLADQRGKAVLIDFWALSCSSCIKKMPYLKQLADAYRAKGLEVLSVAFEEAKDQTKVEAVLNKVGADWPLSFANRTYGPNKSELYKHFGFTYVGEVFLIDQEGRLMMADYRMEVIQERIEKLLGRPGPP